MDICTVILEDHAEQRGAFAILDQVDPHDAEKLGPLWDRLAVLLEVHAEAEEKFFYPRLLHVGTGATDAPSAAEETEDAIHDHNEIRDAVHAVSRHEVASEDWWKAVTEARKANSDHMAEEEREALADFRRHADLQTRHEIALAFRVYEAEYYRGIHAENHDPSTWVDKHSS